MSETATEEVTLYELIEMALDARQRELNVAFPAKVVSYDAAKQTVSVVPQLNRHVPDGQGAFVAEKLPTLLDVPVCFQRGGGYFMSLPIAADDYVMIIVCQKNIGKWRADGEQGDPGDTGSHTIDGAVAIPGLFPDSKALSTQSSNHMVLGKDGTPASQAVFDGSQVLLGGGDQLVALANKVNHNFDVLWFLLDQIFGAASAPIVTPAPGFPDPVYVALKAEIAGLVGSGDLPPESTSAANVKAT